MARPMHARGWVGTLLLIGLLGVTTGCGGSEARKARHVEDGREFMAERNYTKARIEFRNALQIDPKDAEVRALVGLTSQKLGEYDDAVKAYRVALATDESLVEVRARLARILAVAGLADEAADLLAPGLQKAPDSAELLSVRALLNAQQGQMPEARKDAERAYQLMPDDYDVVATLAGLQWQVGEREQSVALVRNALDAQPDNLDLRLLHSRMLLTLDKPAAAERELVEVVRLDPSNYDYRYALAQVYLLQGRIEQATEVLRRAATDFPQKTDAKIALAQLLASHRSFEEAERQLQIFKDKTPTDYDLQLAIGRFYDANGREEQATAVYSGLIKEAATRAQGKTARGRLAALYARMGKLDEASKLVDDVLRENPADPEALVTRAEIAFRRGDAAASVADLRIAFGNQPESVPIAIALAKAHATAGEVELAEQTLRQVLQVSPRNMQARLALASFLSSFGKEKQAVTVLEQLLEEQPGNVEVLEGLARLQVAGKDVTGAMRRATAIQSLEPSSSKGFLLEGQARKVAGDLDDARRAFERAAEIDRKAIEPVAELVRLDMEAQQPEQALARLDGRLTKNPDNVVLLGLRGDALLVLKRPAEAAASFAMAAKLMPMVAQFYRGESAAYMAAGQHEQAIAVLKQGLVATRQSSAVAFDLAAVYAGLGRIDEAVEIYDSILNRRPTDDRAANNLAMLLVTHRTDQASLDRASLLTQRFADSTVPAYMDTYGWVLYRRGQYAEATAVLQAASEKVPSSREFRYHLGMAQLKLGQAEAARRSLQAAIVPGPEFDGLEEAKAALAEL